jgi:ankyrin repeat protein
VGSPLETAAVYKNDFAISALIKSGVRLTFNAVSYLVRTGDAEVAPILEAYQDLNENRFGSTLLQTASWGGNIATMKLLLKYGAAPSLLCRSDGMSLRESTFRTCSHDMTWAMMILENADEKYGRPPPNEFWGFSNL